MNQENVNTTLANVRNRILKGSELAYLQQRLSISRIRTLFTMIGTGEERPFTPPHMSSIVMRLSTNVSYFLVNYLLIATLVLAVTLMGSPLKLFLICIIAAGWVLVYKQYHSPTKEIVVLDKKINERLLVPVVGVGSFFVALLMVPLIINSVCLSCVFCGLHAACRDTKNLKEHTDELDFETEV